MIMNQNIKRELFHEITDHLLKDEKPSKYISMLSQDKDYSGYPFTMLWKLKETEQSEKYHPEGSVWNHTMLVLDEAARVRADSKDDRVFMWAALLHDIGKPDTTRKRHGRITSYDHDKAGEKLSIDFLNSLTDDSAFIQKVSALVRYHMHMLYVLRELPYADTANLLRRVDINDIALLARSDRLGRTGADIEAEDAEYREFLSKLRHMAVKAETNRL